MTPTTATSPIYLDGFATMPLAAQARDAMFAAWSEPGNAGSAHGAGERAAALIAEGRSRVAQLVNASSAEIIFTSGATEANNLALFGAAEAHTGRRRRIVISAIEHKSVIEPVLRLKSLGFLVDIAPVDHFGRLDLAAFAALMSDDVLLASVMAVNNETGVIQPIGEAAAHAHASGVLFHCDAAQAVGKIPIDVMAWDIDFLSLSGHKCYGPLGIGALYIAAGTPPLSAQVFGGGQQRGLRPGTEPVALIAGLGAAAIESRLGLARYAEHAEELAVLLEQQLTAHQVRFSRITGDHGVVPGSLALQFAGADADLLCVALGKEVFLSTGSACASGQLKSSHVLEAMGFSSREAREVVRILCPRDATLEDMKRAAALIATAARRATSPLDDLASGV